MTRKSNRFDPMGQMAEVMTNWQKTGFGSINAFDTSWLEKMNEMGSEWLHFFSARLTQDVEFQQNLLSAQSPQEFQSIQSDFLSKAMDDYSEQTGKMLKLSSRFFDTQ